MESPLPADSDNSLPIDQTERRKTWIAAAVVAIVTIIALGRISTHAFLRWDDDINIYENPNLKSVGYCWQHPIAKLYIPVAYTVWGLLASFAGDSSSASGGLDPHVFHTASLAFHVVAAMGVLLVLRQLGLRPWPAGFGALIFAVHPLQTETVAWATGLRDILSGGLCIWAIWFYLRAIEFDDDAHRQRSQYLLGTLLFIMGMLSKPQAVCLPLVVFGIEILRRPQEWRQWIGYLIPWVVLTLPIIWATRQFQPGSDGRVAAPLADGLLIASDDLVFYVEKLVVPIDLTTDYDHTTQRLLETGPHVALWLVLPALLVLVWYSYRHLLWLAVGIITFIFALIPVLGFVPFNFQTYSNVADHYLYLAMLGPALIGASVWQVAEDYHAPKPAIACIGSALVGVMAFVTFHQAGYWKDTLTLFSRNLRLHPDSFAANSQMGIYSVRADRLDDACAFFEHAVVVRPNTADGIANLANALYREGRYEEAAKGYRRAVQLSPQRPELHTCLALVLLCLNKNDEATDEFQAADQLQPGNADVLVHLAKLAMQRQDVLAAKSYLSRALGTRPDYAPARDMLQRIEQPLMPGR